MEGDEEMAVREFTVNISPALAMNAIEAYIMREEVTGTLVDWYVRLVGEHEVHVIIFEKYTMRTTSRASLTVTIDNFGGDTKVHAVASGGSAGPHLHIDWGARENFLNSVEAALGDSIIQEV